MHLRNYIYFIYAICENTYQHCIQTGSTLEIACYQYRFKLLISYQAAGSANKCYDINHETICPNSTSRLVSLLGYCDTATLL